MIHKTAKHQYFFETDLKKMEDSRGSLTAPHVRESIEVATPPQFPGGIAGIWSPEELFLGSISSCLMMTYLSFAAKRNLSVAAFECSVIGQVELVEGRLEFTIINLYPKIFIQHAADIEIGEEVLLKTYKHCIIANSVSAQLVHHGEVLVAQAISA